MALITNVTPLGGKETVVTILSGGVVGPKGDVGPVLRPRSISLADRREGWTSPCCWRIIQKRSLVKRLLKCSALGHGLSSLKGGSHPRALLSGSYGVDTDVQRA